MTTGTDTLTRHWIDGAWQEGSGSIAVVNPATGETLAEVPAGGAAGRHTHPGIETGYVLEGELNLLIDGQPEKTLKAGDSYQIPAGVVHDAKAHGDKAMKVLGVYVVDKTKPLASPAP